MGTVYRDMDAVDCSASLSPCPALWRTGGRQVDLVAYSCLEMRKKENVAIKFRPQALSVDLNVTNVVSRETSTNVFQLNRVNCTPIGSSHCV